MKFYIYVAYDKKLGCFLKPNFSEFGIENSLESLKRSFKVLPEDQKTKVIDLDYYFCGTFDDNDGLFDLDKKLLCSASDYISLKTNGVDNGKVQES